MDGLVQSRKRKYGNQACKQMLVLGILQVVCGVLTIVFTTIYWSVNYVFVLGLLFGAVFILSGGFAIGTVLWQMNCMIIACVSIGVFALCFAITLLLLTTTGSGRTRSLPSSCTSLMRSSDEDIYCPFYTVQPMDASLIVLSVVEMVVSVWQSIVCLFGQTSSGATTQRSNSSRDSDTGPYIVSANNTPAGHVQFSRTSPSRQLQVMSPSGYFSSPRPSFLGRPAVQGTDLPSRGRRADQGTYPPTSQGTGVHSSRSQPPSYDEVTSAPPAYTDVIGSKGRLASP